MRLILASQSPRRKQLLAEAGYKFETIPCQSEEIIADGVSIPNVPIELARQKAEEVYNNVNDESAIVIGSDTIVSIDNLILGKPNTRQDAINTLQKLSNDTHEVITGVVIKSKGKLIKFNAISKVTFAILSLEEIEYYIDNFNPYDKAGAYGIQDWIGLCKVKNIDGLYSNIMGLPVQILYDYLEGMKGELIEL